MNFHQTRKIYHGDKNRESFDVKVEIAFVNQKIKIKSRCKAKIVFLPTGWIQSIIIMSCSKAQR